jgi:Domain of unknown function (DUF2017)
VYSSRIQRTESGEIRLRLPAEEQALLRQVAASTRALLADGDDPSLRRLFPPASDDPELDQEYRELMRGQLAAGRERALERLEATVDREALSPEEADLWLRALNDVRLVLGTRLDVTEDLDWDALNPHDPRAPELALYAYVSWIQELLVAAST